MICYLFYLLNEFSITSITFGKQTLLTKFFNAYYRPELPFCNKVNTGKVINVSIKLFTSCLLC